MWNLVDIFFFFDYRISKRIYLPVKLLVEHFVLTTLLQDTSFTQFHLVWMPAYGKSFYVKLIWSEAVWGQPSNN